MKTFVTGIAATVALGFGVLPASSIESSESLAPLASQTLGGETATEHAQPQDTTIRISEGASGSQVVVLDEVQGDFRRNLDIPARMRVITSGVNADIIVLDREDEPVATIRAGLAYFDDGSRAESSMEVRGNQLIQTITAPAGYGGNVYLYVPVERVNSSSDKEVNSQMIKLLESKKSDFGAQPMAYYVVPSRYEYNLNHPERGLHDYCTLSPDGYYNGTKVVLFHGPCARHDLAYDDANARSIWADNKLGDEIATNCAHFLSAWDWNYWACVQQGRTYETVVKGMTYGQLVFG